MLLLLLNFIGVIQTAYANGSSTAYLKETLVSGQLSTIESLPLHVYITIQFLCCGSFISELCQCIMGGLCV